MQQRRPLILISNDDGVAAKGINELIRFLRPAADLIVMAPDSPRSGMAAAITSQNPISFCRSAKKRDYPFTGVQELLLTA